MTQRRTFLVPIIAAAALALPGVARADVIDGNWCHDDGRHMSIRGPEIVTPGGARMQGDYSRHSFTYVIPATEPAAGQTVYMLLLNENTVRLQIGSFDAATPAQIWHRCTPSVS